MIVNEHGVPYICSKDEGPFSEETHEKIKIIFDIVMPDGTVEHSEYYVWGPKTRPYACFKAEG